ncbi:FAD-dependent oxidoreductase [Rhizobium sp. Leaf384]|uniref:FAD-dependent monooxygenase n=1 Tax=Rhizobium sp. Leaf384 TaxID=1736358 RepID=UPI000714C3F6|nr:FAD-dependent monooxygenase [Rhizobium sp. Leaf384]KQS79528.1 FAD-dependent oxidoreductase [Rhizobium sp. Leaf384]
MNNLNSIYDVVIAGAGPVGLFLANELCLGGAAVLVLEKTVDQRNSFKRRPFGVRGLSAPSVEAFYRRGMLSEIAKPLDHPTNEVDLSLAAHRLHQPRTPAGHFAGIQFFQDKIDARKWPYRLEGPAGIHLGTTLEQVEAVLAAHARSAGARILYDHAVTDFQQSSDGVVVTAGSSTFQGRWLVGCDGGRGVVRRVGGFEFVGTDAEFTGYSLLAEIAHPDPLPVGRHYTPEGMFNYQAPDTISIADFDGGAFHRTQPITLEHVQAVLRRVSGLEVTLSNLRLATTWTDRAYQVTSYRNGRVLLAGDAAHIHSPLGGQGLNLGLGDAMNLGWKLASTVRGTAPEGLLNSYTAERHPVGARVLDWSRAQVAVMRPSRSSRALEAIFRDLVETGDGATYFAERVWGLRLRYELGSGDPLIGSSAPDFEFVDGGRLGDRLRKGNGVLLDFNAGSPLARHQLGGSVEYLWADVEDRLGLSALLVRPDGVVAWAARGAADYETFSQAAQRWFRLDGGRERT